jgi:ribosomal protein S14
LSGQCPLATLERMLEPKVIHEVGPAYTRCSTCGRYLTPEDRVSSRFCSAACAETYRRCSNCGRHYAATAAYSEEHCSAACAKRYTMHRSYGPAHIDIAMEDLI